MPTPPVQARSPDPSPFLFGADFVRLRHRLEAARSEGVIFDRAWVDAIATVNLSPETRAAATATKHTWERACEGQPATAGDVCVTPAAYLAQLPVSQVAVPGIDGAAGSVKSIDVLPGMLDRHNEPPSALKTVRTRPQARDGRDVAASRLVVQLEVLIEIREVRE